ncbi:hypothetical protein LOD99_15909 [Oopsacas minuta]|uniref:Transposase n=1 Tax=Oopsacas minuta TaxID=111878 RepID=A0AAV7K7L0_9METZ|nr:hypothetical protein LOD99_15909 [Oopsacas minuta]
MKYSKPWATLVPMLSETNKLLRIEWGKKNENIDWCHAVFADEASFWLKPGRVRLWTKRNQKFISQQPSIPLNYTFGQPFRVWGPSLCVHRGTKWLKPGSRY